ncbi:60S ribosomal subunit assembly/export protein Loc1p [Monosporozyma servazzii]
MVAQRFKKGKSKYQSTQREVRPEIFKDSVSRNQLNDSITATESRKDAQLLKAKQNQKYKVDKFTTAKDQKKVRLYGKKAVTRGREYNAKIKIDEEKDIPRLNRAIIPGMKLKRGKKGKKFIGDNDSLVWQRLVKTIGDKYDQINESKVEKDRRLEEIREIKRKEIELKEEAKSQQLEEKKDEIKNKASAARSLRRKQKRDAIKEELKEQREQNPKKKSVSFA